MKSDNKSENKRKDENERKVENRRQTGAANEEAQDVSAEIVSSGAVKRQIINSETMNPQIENPEAINVKTVNQAKMRLNKIEADERKNEELAARLKAKQIISTRTGYIWLSGQVILASVSLVALVYAFYSPEVPRPFLIYTTASTALLVFLAFRRWKNLKAEMEMEETFIDFKKRLAGLKKQELEILQKTEPQDSE